MHWLLPFPVKVEKLAQEGFLSEGKFDSHFLLIPICCCNWLSVIPKETKKYPIPLTSACQAGYDTL
jgi:hypothetical protein